MREHSRGQYAHSDPAGGRRRIPKSPRVGQTADRQAVHLGQRGRQI